MVLLSCKTKIIIEEISGLKTEFISSIIYLRFLKDLINDSRAVKQFKQTVCVALIHIFSFRICPKRHDVQLFLEPEHVSQIGSHSWHRSFEE